MDREVAREKPEHAQYIYGFRVHVCTAYLEGSCPNDAHTCFHTHARTPRRRKPFLQVERFNYIPTRCRYIAEEKECPQGVQCRFAHVTEEIIYHPSKYKTQFCSHSLDADGSCSGFGKHCAKAHGAGEMRTPIFESPDDAPVPVYDPVRDRTLFTCLNPHDREIERKYFMYVYKTHRCEGFPWNCQCDGLDYHREEERRRGPVITYVPIACPFIKPNNSNEWGDPRYDCSGKYKPKINVNGNPVPAKSDNWDCEFAHTMLEIMYHPQVYKTGQCDHFAEEPSQWKCLWKRRCAHAHGKEDARGKEESAEEWKNHLRITVSAQQLPQLLARVTYLTNANATSRDSVQVPTTPNSGNRGHHARSSSHPVDLNQISSHLQFPSPTSSHPNTSNPQNLNLRLPSGTGGAITTATSSNQHNSVTHSQAKHVRSQSHSVSNIHPSQNSFNSLLSNSNSNPSNAGHHRPLPSFQGSNTLPSHPQSTSISHENTRWPTAEELSLSSIRTSFTESPRPTSPVKAGNLALFNFGDSTASNVWSAPEIHPVRSSSGPSNNSSSNNINNNNNHPPLPTHNINGSKEFSNVTSPSPKSSSDHISDQLLLNSLQCALSAHTLQDPVSSYCCGLTVCRNCVPKYIRMLDGTPDHKTCHSCGRYVSDDQLNLLTRAPPIQALAKILAVLQHRS